MYKALWPVTQQFNNKNGSILTSGKIYIYYQGRTALATTYHDEDGTVVNSNPVLLDNNGRATVFASPMYSYTIVVCDYYGQELFSQDITLHDAVSVAKDVLVLGTNGTVLVDTENLPNGVKYDISVNTDIIATKKSVDDVKTDLTNLTEVVNNHTTEIGQIKDNVAGIESSLTNKKDKQPSKSFTGSATKTIKNISQNANGELTVEFADIDLPQEVPNVEITSEDKSIQVTETTDVVTNTKKFDLSVNVNDPLEYGQFRATNVTSQAQLTKINGNLELNNYAIKLKKGNSYHFTVRGSYVANSAVNTNSTIVYIEPISFNNIQVNVDNTITDAQFFEISYDVYKLSSDKNYNVAFSSISDGKVSELLVEVHNLNGVSVNGQGGGSGTTYTAGDGISINSENEISVDYIHVQHKLIAGNGISIDQSSNTISAYRLDDLYSTDEIPIGKWIDGKTIYRKVTTTYGSSGVGQWNSIVVDSNFVSSVDSVFRAKICSTYTNGPYWAECISRIYNGTIQAYGSDIGWNRGDTVIIEYTKKEV